MFVQHNHLKVLKVPAAKVARLNTSAGSVQLAFSGYPPQMARAYLVALSGGEKVLILVGFFLSESKTSIFFVPKQGEVPVEDTEAVFEEGFVFAESMGFVMGETDYHLMTSDDQQKMWDSLPISQTEEKKTEKGEGGAAVGRPLPQAKDLETYRKRSLESLGRFLASL